MGLGLEGFFLLIPSFDCIWKETAAKVKTLEGYVKTLNQKSGKYGKYRTVSSYLSCTDIGIIYGISLCKNYNDDSRACYTASKLYSHLKRNINHTQ